MGPEIKLSRKAIAFVRLVCVLSFIIWGVCFVISSGVYNRRFFSRKPTRWNAACVQCRLHRSCYAFTSQHLSAWTFGAGCARYKAHCIKESLYSRKPTFVGLNLFVRVALQKVSECLKVSHECLKVSRTERNCCLPWSVKSVIYFKYWVFVVVARSRTQVNMGISIEQFRSRIGSHDNFVKTKDASSRFKDRFWNIMLMMFYLNVFYLPILKQVVIQYKMCNQVMFWFTQMMCYNV